MPARRPVAAPVAATAGTDQVAPTVVAPTNTTGIASAQPSADHPAYTGETQADRPALRGPEQHAHHRTEPGSTQHDEQQRG